MRKSIFDRMGIDQVNKVVGILHDNTDEGVNVQGERLFAEVVTYMVDNGIKVEKGADVLEPIKSVLEEKLDDVHNNLKNHEDWNEEYQSLLSQERKYLYALNRIEQYETEQKCNRPLPRFFGDRKGTNHIELPLQLGCCHRYLGCALQAHPHCRCRHHALPRYGYRGAHLHRQRF